MKLRVPNFNIHITAGAIYNMFPPSVLFGISFTLKAYKKLTARINCFHL